MINARHKIMMQNWTHWGLNPGPPACWAGVIPLHHVPNARVCAKPSLQQEPWHASGLDIGTPGQQRRHIIMCPELRISQKNKHFKFHLAREIFKSWKPRHVRHFKDGPFMVERREQKQWLYRGDKGRQSKGFLSFFFAVLLSFFPFASVIARGIVASAS